MGFTKSLFWFLIIMLVYFFASAFLCHIAYILYEIGVSLVELVKNKLKR